MKIAVFAAVVLLAGCVTSPVAELTPGTYTVSINSSFAGSSRSALQTKVASRADEFCAKQGGAARIINQNITGIVGVTAGGITIAFSCEPTAAAANSR